MSKFVTAMRFVGDLDDEFYYDERQRDVWNEASAVGMQMFLWAALIAGAVLPWVAGRTGSFISIGILAVYLTVAFSVLHYARHRGVDMHTSQKLTRPRIFLATALYLVGAGSAITTLILGMTDGRPAFSLSIFGGGALGLAAAALGLAANQRRERERERAAEAAEREELASEE